MRHEHIHCDKCKAEIFGDHWVLQIHATHYEWNSKKYERDLCDECFKELMKDFDSPIG
jgi:hypothetical protein